MKEFSIGVKSDNRIERIGIKADYYKEYEDCYVFYEYGEDITIRVLFWVEYSRQKIKVAEFSKKEVAFIITNQD